MRLRRSTATYAHKWNVLSTIIISTGGLMRISGIPSSGIPLFISLPSPVCVEDHLYNQLLKATYVDDHVHK